MTDQPFPSPSPSLGESGGVPPNLIDQMSKLRSLTMELIETVCVWRSTIPNHDPQVPRPFIYEQQNDLLKLIPDLNFLSSNDLTLLSLF
jgi:hypothetical protein